MTIRGSGIGRPVVLNYTSFFLFSIDREASLTYSCFLARYLLSAMDSEMQSQVYNGPTRHTAPLRPTAMPLDGKIATL